MHCRKFPICPCAILYQQAYISTVKKSNGREIFSLYSVKNVQLFEDGLGPSSECDFTIILNRLMLGGLGYIRKQKLDLPKGPRPFEDQSHF